jgi:ferredoxin
MADITFSGPLLKTDETVQGVAGDTHTLLAVAKQNGVPVPFNCEVGDCCSCLVKVTVLENKQPIASTLSEKEKYTLAAHGKLSKDAKELAEVADIPPHYRLACQYIVRDEKILVEFSGLPGVEIDPDRPKHERAALTDIETTGAEDRSYADHMSRNKSAPPLADASSVTDDGSVDDLAVNVAHHPKPRIEGVGADHLGTMVNDGQVKRRVSE